MSNVSPVAIETVKGLPGVVPMIVAMSVDGVEPAPPGGARVLPPVRVQSAGVLQSALEVVFQENVDILAPRSRLRRLLAGCLGMRNMQSSD